MKISSTTPSQFQTWLEVEFSQLRSATPVVSYRIWVRRVHLTCKALWSSGLGHSVVSKKFAIQTLLWTLIYVIRQNLKRNIMALFFFHV